MGKNQSASNLTNIIRQDADGGIAFMSGSTMLMALSNTGQMSGSVPVLAASTASFVANAQSASYVLTAQTASFVANAQSASNAVSAQTASFANTFTVNSTLTAQTLVVQTITSSIDFVTGSTRFGTIAANTHQFTGSVSVEGTGNFYQPLTNSTSYLTIKNNRARNAAVYTETTNGGFYAGTSIGTDTFNYQIYDGITGLARITVDSVGNIGMGTSNPVATLPTGSSILINNGWKANSSIITSRKVLEINSNDNNGGNVGIFLRHLDKVTGLDIWSDNYYGNAYIDSRYDSNDAYISFRLRTANQANIIQPLTITATGNVGIGTNSPATILEVVNPTLATDTVNTLLTQRWSRKQTGAVKWGNSIDLLLGSYESGTINSRSRVDFRLANGATDTPDTTVMTLQGNGNVGIGTNAPSSTFHVRGTFGAPSTTGASLNGIARLGQTSGNGALDIGFGDPYSWLQSRNITDYSTNYNLSLQPNGGNVGIGTISPYTKLHTNGSIGMGSNSAGYPINAKLVKQSTNTITFTASVGTIGAWRPGYATIRVAAAQNGLQETTAAWYFIRVVSYFSSSAGVTVISSGGDTGSYTFSGSGTGSGSPQTITFTIADANASTDTIIADIDFSYTEGIISIS